jgi:hypothetical protein
MDLAKCPYTTLIYNLSKFNMLKIVHPYSA